MTDSGTSIVAMGLLVAVGLTAAIIVVGEVWSMVAQWREQRKAKQNNI